MTKGYPITGWVSHQVNWPAFAAQLRKDASGEDGRMSASVMYQLADILDTLPMQVEAVNELTLLRTQLEALEQEMRASNDRHPRREIRRWIAALRSLRGQ